MIRILIFGLARLVLSLISLVVLISAILSWFPPRNSSKIEYYIRRISDIIVYPMRSLCYKLNIGRNSPIDIPFLLTVIIVLLLESIIR